MLRIISGLLLLIISQITFASVSTTTKVVPASTAPAFYVYTSGFGNGPKKASAYDACVAAAGWMTGIYAGNAVYAHTYFSNTTTSCVLKYNYGNNTTSLVITNSGVVYVCSSGVLSTSGGVVSSSGTYCNQSVTVDSCTSYAGQSGYFWVNKVNPPSTICSGTCLASSAVVAGFPDADPLSWIYLKYIYTGETSGCSADSGFTDDSSAADANEAAAEKERLAKIQQAIADAKSACGGDGTYTEGTFNGDTVITCKTKPTQTTVNDTATSTTTTANPDGSTTTTTTTTTTNNTSVTNNNSSTTVSGSNGGTSTSPATTGGSSTSTTKTETVTTNPDGSTTTDVTETTSGAGNTAGVFESPGEGTDYLKDVFGSESIKQLVDQQEVVKDQIKVLQGNIKGLFSFSSIAAGGSMAENRQTIMGASVDLSGKSVIDMFTQGNIGSAFWILAVLIGISIILTKRNN